MRYTLAAAAAALFLPIIAVAGVQTPPAAAAQTKPNIIVIMTDDMRADDLDVMPNARQIIGPQNGLGAKYENTIDNVPLCCPSRVSFLTGQYTHNHGVISNEESEGGGWQTWNEYTEQTESLPIWLNNTGYRTQMFGKYLNEYGMPAKGNSDTFVPNGWDWFFGMVHGAGYNGFDVNEDGTVVAHPNAYSTNWFTDRAVGELDQHLDSDVPMFQWVSFYAPHDGPQDANTICNVPADPQYAGMFNPGVPSGAAFNEADVSDKPAWIQNMPPLTQAEQNDVAECRGERRDALKSVDNAIGRIRNEVAQANELSNTYFVFISDNGFMLGEHRVRSGKQYSYEPSANVPLLIRGPGMPTGTKTRIVSNVDLTASIVKWAGAGGQVPGGFLDGQPVETAPVAGSQRAVLVERFTPTGQLELPLFAGLRMSPDVMFTDYATGLDELYDGPDQISNHIGDPAYDPIEADMRALVAELDDCGGFQTPASASTTDCNVELVD